MRTHSYRYLWFAVGLAVTAVTVDRLWVRHVNHDVLSRYVQDLHRTLKHNRHTLEALQAESRQMDAQLQVLSEASDSLSRQLEVHRRMVIEQEAVLSFLTQPQVTHAYPDSVLLSELHRLLRDAHTRSGAR